MEWINQWIISTKTRSKKIAVNYFNIWICIQSQMDMYTVALSCNFNHNIRMRLGQAFPLAKAKTALYSTNDLVLPTSWMQILAIDR